MGRKARSRAHSSSPTKIEPPLRTLQRLKALWAAGDWAEALSAYRAWTARTGKPRDPRIEAELVFRCASRAYRDGQLDRALARLAEANALDPGNARRCFLAGGICLARKGRLKEGIERLTQAGDNYHATVLSHLVEHGRPLPANEPQDLPCEATQLLGFWRGLTNPDAAEPSSLALRKLRSAYYAVAQAADPDPALTGLADEPGFANLVQYLTFLAAVVLRRNIRIRHLIAADPAAFRDASLLALLDSHLLLLMKEKQYREIEVLKGICDEHHIRPSRLDEAMDELLFTVALDEIETGRLEVALERLQGIRRRTLSLIHNLALLYQKLGEFVRANEHWITLLRADGKPKRSDPEERRLAWATAARQIASNYLVEDQLEEAVRFYKEALSVVENDREALENLAGTSLELRDFQAALVYARRLYELDPEDPQYLVGYMSTLLASSRNVDTLLHLTEERWKRVAPGSSLSRTLAEIAIQAAWRLRESKPEKSREIVALVREADPELPFLVHLEGYFLARDGSGQEAEAKFERLIELTKNHTEQTLLGLALYSDGFRDHAFSMFKRLIACGCETSADAFEHVLTYLGERNDREAARELCLWALGRDEYDEYIVADMLRDAGRPQWAHEFSQRLIENPGADEEDYFLHFLVLNDMGNPSETIEFAKVMKSRFMAGEHHPAEGTFMDYVLKELKRKGRVSLYG